jgi:hypothetical protein
MVLQGSSKSTPYGVRRKEADRLRGPVSRIFAAVGRTRGIAEITSEPPQLLLVEDV